MQQWRDNLLVKGSVKWRITEVGKLAEVCYRFRTVAIDICLFSIFCRLLYNLFPFPPSTDELLGDAISIGEAHRTRSSSLLKIRQHYWHTDAHVPTVMAHRTWKKLKIKTCFFYILAQRVWEVWSALPIGAGVIVHKYIGAGVNYLIIIYIVYLYISSCLQISPSPLITTLNISVSLTISIFPSNSKRGHKNINTWNKRRHSIKR